MTPQEEQLLSTLIDRINGTQLAEKDPDAEALLNKELATNPDALYILAQTVLVQNIALEQAKVRVAQLEQQAQPAPQQPAHATSFLGSLLGHRNPPPGPAPVPVQAAPQAGYQPVNPQYAQPYVQPEYVQSPYAPGVMSGPPSFLRGAMQTAAGVAAGALAFEGVESILHGFGHPGYGWGMGPGLIGGQSERPVEVINNYYDDGRSPETEHHGLDTGEHHFHESADQGGAQIQDASYDTQGDRGNDDFSNLGDDTGNFDNSNADNGSGFGDQGGFDDGGGFDGGSGGDLL